MGGEGLVELRQVCEYGQPVGHLVFDHVFGVQQRRDPEVTLRRAERQLVVYVDVVLLQAGEVNEVGPEVVYESAERESIPPGRGHVLHLHPRIAVSHPLAPQLQRLHPALLTHGDLLRQLIQHRQHILSALHSGN